MLSPSPSGMLQDRMDKSVKGAETFFTDDGFAIGLAYILAILGQVCLSRLSNVLVFS